MAHPLLTQDLLCFALLVAEGDTRIPIAELINRGEMLLRKQEHLIGISAADWGGMFYSLVYLELGLKKYSEPLDGVLLRDLIKPILSYFDVYCNDEGEHWCCMDCYPHSQNDIDSIAWRYGYTREQYLQHLEAKSALQEYFTADNADQYTPPKVLAFVRGLCPELNHVEQGCH